MKKSELITLLECIKLRNEDDVKFFLKLDLNEIKILKDNKEKSQFLYDVIRKFKYNKCYECILKNAIKVNKEQLQLHYIDLVSNEKLRSSGKFKFIIESIMKIEDYKKIIAIINLLISKSAIVREVIIKNEIEKIITLDIEQINLISNIIKYDSAANWIISIDFIKKTYEIKDKNILNNLSSIYEKISYSSYKFEEVNSIFNSIEEILKINNLEVVNNILEDILNEMQKEQKTKEISIFDKTKELIEERNIVSAILKLDKKALLDGLNVLSDDEEITQNTYVKKHIL